MSSLESSLSRKEPRDKAVTIRLPASVVKKLKVLSLKYNRSQSELIEMGLSSLLVIEDQSEKHKRN